MGGKSSAPDTSGMERATREANQLQERIYDESIERGQPYYDVGVSGLGLLADYMGLNGGTLRTEQQIRDELLPQYTATKTVGRSGDTTYLPSGIEALSFDSFVDQYIDGTGQSRDTLVGAMPGIRAQYDKYASNPDLYAYGLSGGELWRPEMSKTVESVDNAALNAAVRDQISAQGGITKPDYFGSLLQTFGEDQFRADPGYQFRMEEGNKALERQLAAQGKTFSPEAAKALMNFNQGLADQTYMDAYSRYNADQANVYNRLANIAGLGQTQTAQMAGLGQQYASTVGNNLTNLATAQSQAQQAAAQNRSSMFGNILGLGAQVALAPTTGGGSLIGGLF